MTKFSKILLMIIVCTVFLLMDHFLTDIWHAIFIGGVIGWAAMFLVDSIDYIITEVSRKKGKRNVRY